MTLEEKISLLENVMELDEGELDVDAQLDDIEEWDSFAKLSLMVAIKKSYKKAITVEELRSFQTIGDICDYLD